MKITDIKAWLLEFNHGVDLPPFGAQSHPLMYYEEYQNSLPRLKRSPRLESPGDAITSKIMIEITTDEGISGIHMPCDHESQAEFVLGFKDILIGKDPLATRTLWDMMDRSNIRARAGIGATAIAAIDCALWDLKGKVADMPVYKLLGGGRERIRPYMSVLGVNTDDPEEIKKTALKHKDEGIICQKYFFKYGPSHGFEGLNKNVALAYTLREALGKDYLIAFDTWSAWDLSYCLRILPEIEPMKPYWIEEPLRTDRLEAFKSLRERTNLQISLGEKLYNRFELHSFLRERVIDIYQPEPEIAGGITEITRMGEMCEVFGVKYMPHGYSLMPNLSVSLAMSPDITPMIEWLSTSIIPNIYLNKIAPRIENGWITAIDEPGLCALDESKLISKTPLRL